jgi:hypothetical protein
MGKLDLMALAHRTSWPGYFISNTPISSTLVVERIRLLFERPLRDPYLPGLRIIIIIITTSRPYTFYILLAILDFFSLFESFDVTPPSCPMAHVSEVQATTLCWDRGVHGVPPI